MIVNAVEKQESLKFTHRDRIEQLVGKSHRLLPVQSTLAAAIGCCGNYRCMVVATDPAVTSGAIGVSETLELRKLIARAQREAVPLVLLIDSAGARVSEGVGIQGALRHLFADLLTARAAGLRTIAILGRNVFGGASMLAMLCETRFYAECTRLAMTGPAVLQSRNAVSSQTVAQTITAASRLEHDRQGALFTNAGAAGATCLREMLQQALAGKPQNYHSWLRALGMQLRARLTDDFTPDSVAAVEIVEPGFLKLCGSQSAGPHDVIRLVDALQSASAVRRRIVLVCEWAGHSMQLAEEDALLSQYLAYLCSVIHAIGAGGTPVHLHIVDELSGGLYIALAAGSSEVRLLAGGRVRTLTQEVLDAFVKMPVAPEPDADTLIEHGVIDTTES